jgi:hypothetical protein
MLHANLAWGHAKAGDSRQALTCIGRARDEYGRAEREESPPWLTFFDSAELQGLRGITLSDLPDLTPEQRADAIDRFSLSTAMRELTQARSRTFDMTALSRLLIEDGAVEQGIQVGHEAVDMAAHVRSQRVIDRFAPLRAVLADRPADNNARELAERIKALARLRQQQ